MVLQSFFMIICSFLNLTSTTVLVQRIVRYINMDHKFENQAASSNQSKWIYDWDHLESEYSAKVEKYKKKFEDVQKPPVCRGVTRHFYFIRHGQYVKEKEDEGCVLTELGRKQAKITGERLLNSKICFDKVHISTQTRANETAEIILNELDPEKKIPQKTSDLLCEGTPLSPDPAIEGYNELITRQELFQDNARLEAAFRNLCYCSKPSLYKPKDDEEDEDPKYDLEEKKDTYELVVGHANVIRYFLLRALQLDTAGWARMAVANCSVTWMAICPDGTVTVPSIGDFGHFSADDTTFA